MQKWFGVLLALALTLPSAALAQDIVGSVVNQLRAQGYDRITVTRTWLGRTRVQAQSVGQQREIVINPVSGEILRDVWQKTKGSPDRSGTLVNPGVVDDDDDRDVDEDDRDDDDGGQGRGRGRGRGGDDDRDDDSDNSGPGSGNSGSGSGGDDGESDNSGPGGGDDD